MEINKVIIIYKKSTYELYHNEDFDKKVQNLIRKRHPAVNRLQDSHQVHMATLDTIISEIAKYDIDYQVISRNELHNIDEYDLVITSGGDGTVLEASKYVKDIPILGVNSDPQGSVGFFTGASKFNFSQVFQDLIADNLNQTTLNRMQLLLNDKLINEPILNDVLICHSIPAATSRYIIRFNGQEEYHRSSGLWVSTAAGSTGAIRSAGGKVMPLESQNLQFIVREFYDRGQKDFSLLGGEFSLGDEFEIVSQMRLGHVFLDGPFFQYVFSVADSLKFRKYKYPLTLFGLDPEARQKFID